MRPFRTAGFAAPVGGRPPCSGKGRGTLSTRGKKLHSPLGKKKNKTKTPPKTPTNQQKQPTVKPFNPTLHVSIWKHLFFWTLRGVGVFTPRGSPPHTPHSSTPLLPLGTAGPTSGEGRARKAGALVTPTDPAAKCSRGQGYGQG